MPQVTCPNCGMTINLENRREIDFDLITNAAKKEPRTFTELLHITKLSRKTLSLRLKELCQSGTLVKATGIYTFNGASGFENRGRNFGKGFSRVLNNGRMRTGLMLLMLLLCSSASGYVLATFLALPQPIKVVDQKPTALGNFTMTLDISNVNDLYAWQVLMVYNSSDLKVARILPGDFVGTECPSSNLVDVTKGIFLNATDIGDDMILLGGSLLGSASGKDGSGSLAIIVFEYFAEEYQEPRIVFDNAWFDTLLLNSSDSIIPIGDPTELTLTISH